MTIIIINTHFLVGFQEQTEEDAVDSKGVCLLRSLHEYFNQYPYFVCVYS